MSPEAQRIKIAEACGWREMPIGGLWQYGDTDRYAQCDRNTEHNCAQLPDCLNDLNAMQCATATLTDAQLTQMAEWLGANNDEFPQKAWVILLRATAAQRAEAFLRALNLWEESK